MIAKKQAATAGEKPPATEERSRRGGLWAVGLATALVACGGGAYAVWRQVRDHVLSNSEYLVDPNTIAITELPPWIHRDVRDDVLAETRVTGRLSLLDPELTVQLAGAFAAHPWVHRVIRVSKKYPSNVEVVLEYRRPVAMVRVKDGVYPVDAEGVLLPSRPAEGTRPADFSRSEAESYPLIGAVHSSPVEVGTRWPDQAVQGAARIAAALADDWQSLGLARIEPAGRKSVPGGSQYVFTLVTRRGTTIHWAARADEVASGETAADEKQGQLKAWVAEHGSLDAADGPRQLVFLENGALAVKPRKEVSPLPTRDD